MVCNSADVDLEEEDLAYEDEQLASDEEVDRFLCLCLEVILDNHTCRIYLLVDV